jgi:hypothetical protein
VRVLVATLATFIAVSCPIAASELPTTEIHVASKLDEAKPVTYTLEWQRRLLAVQLEFAATLEETDPVQTGSITRSVQ